MIYEPPRIQPGRFRELGPINWVVWKVLSRSAGVSDAQLFSTLGRSGGLFRGWLHYAGKLMPGGRLTRHETELVILRVAHLRKCEYEMDHHVRLGRRAGVTAETLERIKAGPAADGWSGKHRALLAATDEIVESKTASMPCWQELSAHYDERRLLEIVLLATQYDALATVIATLRIRRDWWKPGSVA